MFFLRKKDVKHVETYKLAAFQSSTYLFTIHQSLICQHGICYTPPGLPWETILFLVTKWLASSFWSIYQTARSALSMSSTWQRAETSVEATCWILRLKPNIANSLKWRHVCSRRYIVQGPSFLVSMLIFGECTSPNSDVDFRKSIMWLWRIKYINSTTLIVQVKVTREKLQRVSE